MRLLPTLRPTTALRRLGIRLAFVALLAAALMPTLSRLAQPLGFANLASICQVSPPGAPQETSHDHGDACAYCTLANTTPALGGAALPAVAVVAYAPPAPPAPVPVRRAVVRTRAPSARAPPFLA
jgi:hypothetical protein